MPRFAIDIGNSTVKFARFDDEGDARAAAGEALPAPVSVAAYPSRGIDWDVLPPLFADGAAEGAASGEFFVASVRRPEAASLRAWLDARNPPVHTRWLSWRDVPLELDVASPERVGIDRLLAALAARLITPAGWAAIVVDAGSAMTVDAVDARATFRGGAILPGLRLAARSLAEYADQLPEVAFDALAASAALPPVLGRATEAALQSGIYWGSVGAARELIARMRGELDAPAKIFLTGGDAPRLARALEEATLAPHLVLQGIWAAGQMAKENNKS